MNEFRLRPQQLECLQAIAHNAAPARFWLLGEMGSGKTAVIVRALTRLRRDKRVLIVAPKRVADSGWPEELTRQGLEFKRTGRHAPLSRIVVANYEQAEKLRGLTFDVAIFDESTRLKNARIGGKRTYAKTWLELARKTPRCWLVTAEPMPQNVECVHGQALFIGGIDGMPSQLDAFRFLYRQKHPYVLHAWQDQPGAARRVADAIAPHCIRLAAPPADEIVFVRHYVTLNNAARRAYTEMVRNGALHVPFDSTRATPAIDLIAENPAVKDQKLMQLSNGFVYLSDGQVAEFCAAKFDALRELIDSAPNENFLVSCCYKRTMHALQDQFEGAKILSAEKDFVAWNAGGVRLGIVHPKSCGHGLNLQHGGRRLVVLEQDHSNDTSAQVLERLGPRRQAASGYKRTVYVHYILSVGTRDDDVLARHENALNFKNVRSVTND